MRTGYFLLSSSKDSLSVAQNMGYFYLFLILGISNQSIAQYNIIQVSQFATHICQAPILSGLNGISFLVTSCQTRSNLLKFIFIISLISSSSAPCMKFSSSSTSISPCSKSNSFLTSFLVPSFNWMLCSSSSNILFSFYTISNPSSTSAVFFIIPIYSFSSFWYYSSVMFQAIRKYGSSSCLFFDFPNRSQQDLELNLSIFDYSGLTNPLYYMARSISNLVILSPSTVYNPLDASTISYLQLYSFCIGLKLKSRSLRFCLFFDSCLQVCSRFQSLFNDKLSTSSSGSITSSEIRLRERWTLRRFQLPQQSRNCMDSRRLWLAENSSSTQSPLSEIDLRPKLFKNKYYIQLKGGKKLSIGILMTSAVVSSYLNGSQGLATSSRHYYQSISSGDQLKRLSSDLYIIVLRASFVVQERTVLQARIMLKLLMLVAAVSPPEDLPDASLFSLLLCLFRMLLETLEGLEVRVSLGVKDLRLRLPLAVLDNIGAVVLVKYQLFFCRLKPSVAVWVSSEALLLLCRWSLSLLLDFYRKDLRDRVVASTGAFDSCYSFKSCLLRGFN